MTAMSTTPIDDLHIFMSQVADEMASEYARIYAQAAEDPGMAGDEGGNFFEDAKIPPRDGIVGQRNTIMELLPRERYVVVGLYPTCA